MASYLHFLEFSRQLNGPHGSVRKLFLYLCQGCSTPHQQSASLCHVLEGDLHWRWPQEHYLYHADVGTHCRKLWLLDVVCLDISSCTLLLQHLHYHHYHHRNYVSVVFFAKYTRHDCSGAQKSGYESANLRRATNCLPTNFPPKFREPVLSRIASKISHENAVIQLDLSYLVYFCCYATHYFLD